MIFEWDPRKAVSNLRKHAVGFPEAATIFLDALAWTFPDPDHSETESRFITIGLSSWRRIIVVAHAERGDRVRIISARKATRRERDGYSENA
ncbi:MAG: BrnT family toxin [Thermoanaerobaculia bacterium]